MIFDSHNRPVGFLRLVIKTAETEIVIVIGDRKKWGRGLGTLAVRESLRIAFFELRSKRVVARISKDNVRSSRAFRSAGFKAYSETPLMKCYVITFDEYLKRKGDAGLPRQVYITEIDYAKLKSLIKDACIKDGGEKGKALRDLEKEINSAKIVEAKELPGNVITMNSKAVIDMSGDEEEITLVYPQEADIANNKISVLSPIGVAVLGYGEGDTVEWDIPYGVAEIKIKRVLYQPEAAGDYHL